VLTAIKLIKRIFKNDLLFAKNHFLITHLANNKNKISQKYNLISAFGEL
jgi:hypothetical protein